MKGVLVSKRVLIMPLIALSCLFATGCPTAPSEDAQVVARINDHVLTLGEFEQELKQELEFNDDFKMTGQARTQFVERLIRNELLLQEAKKRRLDQREKFIKTIERYWESTLIRDLIQAKNKEIDALVRITDSEVEARYASRFGRLNLSVGERRPLRQRIRDTLHAEKKAELMATWFSQLKEQADIEVFTPLLNRNVPRNEGE